MHKEVKRIRPRDGTCEEAHRVAADRRDGPNLKHRAAMGRDREEFLVSRTPGKARHLEARETLAHGELDADRQHRARAWIPQLQSTNGPLPHDNAVPAEVKVGDVSSATDEEHTAERDEDHHDARDRDEFPPVVTQPSDGGRNTGEHHSPTESCHDARNGHDSIGDRLDGGDHNGLPPPHPGRPL